MTRSRLSPIKRLLPILLAALLCFALAASASGSARPARAHAAQGSHYYMTGIGDEHDEMFSNALWKQLHTKVSRYIAPYDAAVRPYSLGLARAWIRAAEAKHQQILIAFYHSEYTPTRLPSVAQYQHDVQKFVKLFPRVKQFEAWDESNRGNVPRSFSSPSASAAAQYYQALIRVCKGCSVVGLDVLDQSSTSGTLRYISEFKREISKLRTIMPKIWGLHNYSDVNRLESWRTHELVKALGGQVWLTETGGIVQFNPSFPNLHGSGLTRASKALKYMFAVAASVPQIARVYIFDWTGGVDATRFDAGLTDRHWRPRAGYVVVCHQLHGAKCNVRTVHD